MARLADPMPNPCHVALGPFAPVLHFLGGIYASPKRLLISSFYVTENAESKYVSTTGIMRSRKSLIKVTPGVVGMVA
jgi:hypothetical protein